jgi:hypothetical protein
MKQKKNSPKNSRLQKELRQERSLFRRHYATNEKRWRSRLLHHLRLEKPRFWWRERNIWQKIICVILALIILMVGTMYGIARWYIASEAGKDFKFGATFISDYAEYFDLEPKQTMQAMIDDLNIRHFRLVSYWDKIEPTPGHYDFSDLDWQFKKVEAVHGTVSLAIGLRQPRWPECHMPTWAKTMPKEQWYAQVKTFIGKVIDRYKTSPSLESYQLENEYFLKAFGECTDFSRDRLVDEFNYVKRQDPKHFVIISRSNNALGLPVGQPTPDEFGVSVYKRVWDRTITKRYFEYPFPAWFYAFLAGAGKIVTGKDLIIHELQTEPWGPDKGIKEISIAEQNKSLDAKRLTDRIKYGKATGMREIDLWGVEMWYWRKVKLNDPSLWEAGKTAIRDNQCTSCY